MEDYILATLGGLLIGTAAALLLAFNGRIAGISGILGRLVERDEAERSWRLTFLAGLVLGGVVLLIADPTLINQTTGATPLTLGAAGLLVGIGTQMGNGCTSGHGVCGLARLSKRSLVATLTFMGVAGATVFVTHHLLVGG